MNIEETLGRGWNEKKCILCEGAWWELRGSGNIRILSPDMLHGGHRKGCRYYMSEEKVDVKHVDF